MQNKNNNINNTKNATSQNFEKKPKLLPILNPVFLSLFSQKRKYNLENFISCILAQKIKVTKIITEYSLPQSRPEEKISRLDLYATT